MADHAGFYGLGWNIDSDAAGHLHWSHSGGFALGAATAVDLLPGQALGIAALTNGQPIGVPEAVNRSFLDLVLTGKVQKDWFAIYRPRFAEVMAPDYPVLDFEKTPADRSAALPLTAYLGTYDNPLYGAAEIAAAPADGGGLVLRLGPRKDPYPLRFFDRDVFGWEPPGENAAGPSAVTFTVGADSKASALTIANLDRDGQGSFRRTAAAK
jgi:hypothetical protein